MCGILAELGRVPKWKHVQDQMGWYLFQLLIFVNFDMFTIHVLRNCYEKIEWIYF